jgi:hypothetical protein
MTPDFFDLTYLSKGSAIQQAGFRAIQACGIMTQLKEFNAVVVGTLPLDLFTYMSDIDIICNYTDAEKFQSLLRNSSRKKLGGIDSVTSSFEYDKFQFEIVGQPIPVTDQVAYRHMISEWNILEANDDMFRARVLALKRKGVKTEPAFAQILGLKGDPYQALLGQV